MIIPAVTASARSLVRAADPTGGGLGHSSGHTPWRQPAAAWEPLLRRRSGPQAAADVTHGRSYKKLSCSGGGGQALMAVSLGLLGRPGGLSMPAFSAWRGWTTAP